jgi:glycine hydroxymethyltransferase
MTTRGMLEADFVKVAEFLDRVVKICVEIQERKGKKLVDFEKGIDEHEGVALLRKDVEAVGVSLPYPGLASANAA